MSTKLWEFLTDIKNLISGGAVVSIGGSDGTTVTAIRVPTVIKSVENVAIGAAATVWTPAAGKKFRLMGGQFSVTQAGYVKFLDSSGTQIGGDSPYFNANERYPFDWGNGVLAANANSPLKALFSVTGSVMLGYLYGTEE